MCIRDSMNESLDVVEIVAIDGNTRVTASRHELHDLFYRRADLDRNDLRARRHDFANDLVAEMNDRLNHFSFGVGENPFFLTCINECLNFRLCCLFFLLVWTNLFFPAVEIIQYSRHQPREW